MSVAAAASVFVGLTHKQFFGSLYRLQFPYEAAFALIVTSAAGARKAKPASINTENKPEVNKI